MRATPIALFVSLSLLFSWSAAFGGVNQSVPGSSDCEVAWNRLFAKFWVPKTGLLYEHLPDEAPGAVTRFLPTPAEIAKNEPVATGWNTGMEDGVLNGCPLILAAMLRGDEAALEKLMPGALRCATVSKVPGFLARSISPMDGRSHYSDSSRDQYTLFVYTMWRYANSRFCSPARRAEIVRIVTDIARYTEKGMTPANSYTILREDGKCGIVSRMWIPDPAAPIAIDELKRGRIDSLYAHEAERLPMIYAAAYALTGDKHWRTCELKVADGALRLAESGSLDGYAGFALYQMQVSQRLLWECETDPARRERYRKLLHKAAVSSCKMGLERAQKLMDGLKGDLSAPAGDWRTWSTTDASTWAGGKDGILNGLPYRVPDRPKAYLNAYNCVREIGEAVIIPLLCPDSKLDDAYVARFRSLSHKADFSRVMSPGLVYPVLAEAMLAAAGSASAADDIHLYNIVPYSPGREKSVAADILRTHRETGLETFLYCVSLDPRGVPASANVARACESFRKIKAGLTDEVKFGFLLQSIMGHWVRADREIEPWQRSVGPTGQPARFCVLDTRYRDYIRNTAVALAKEKPCFILGDDDIKAFAYGKVECFCPLHTAEFNRRTGRNLTPDQFRAAVRDAKPGDEVDKTFTALRGEITLTVAKTIREGIDSVDPAIPAGGCMSGYEIPSMLPRIQALAGPKHPTVMRFATGDYCEIGREGIASIALRTQAHSQFYGDTIAVKLDESDTFPHTLYSRGERSFHSKLALAFFLGLDGAKLWYVGMDKGKERVPAAYDRALAKNMSMYRSLHVLMRGAKPVGLRLPTFKPEGAHPLLPHKVDFYGDTEWLTRCLVVYGIPWTTDFSRAPGEIVLLEGSNTVNRLADSELDTLFAGRVFADGGAVRGLAARGRTADLGCAPTPDDPIYNMEVVRSDGLRPPLLRGPTLVPLKALSSEARVYSDFRYGVGGGNDADTSYVAVGSCFYDNARGGHVFASAFTVPNQGGFSDQNLRRKEWLVRALHGLDPNFAVVSANDEPNMTLARRATDGSLIVYTLNLGYDDMPSLRYDTPKAVSAERLGGDGKWVAVPTARGGRITEVKHAIGCFECAVLRLREVAP